MVEWCREQEEGGQVLHREQQGEEWVLMEEGEVE